MTKRINYAVMLLLLVVLGSCTAELAEEVMTADGRYVYALELEGEAQDYAGQTRALTTRSWKTGDVVYLRIASSGSTVLGTATYSGGQWTLTTESALSGSGTCQAVSVSNAAGSVSGNTLPLNSASAVYEDKQGTWSRSGNTLKVKAVLNPVLGRLRFKGSSGTSFSLTGLTTYTAYNLSTGTFTTSQAAVTGSIGSTGYSGYIHGLMASSTSPTLQTNGYTMECPSTMMQAGACGWLNYPTASNHTGWTKEGGDAPSDGHAYVDLGLSVKWATCNVGASSAEEYGDYYAWGETATKSYYDWSTYKWCNGSATTMTKYCTSSSYGTVDNKTTLEPSDDVAHVKWGGNWRMPTDDEFAELINTSNCTWTWTTQGGKNGCKVTSKKNGNSIFLPAAGVRGDGSLVNAGSDGIYWSSSLCTSNSYGAYVLNFGSDNVSGDYYSYRYCGRSVRPVCP